MIYKIEIIEVEQDVPFKDREYEVVGKKQDGDNEYGYVYYDSTKDVARTIYTQQVDSLDLVEVINAINKKEK